MGRAEYQAVRMECENRYRLHIPPIPFRFVAQLMGGVTGAGSTHRAVGIARVTDLSASSTDIGPSPNTARWAATEVIIADGVWRRADGSDTPLNWHETCIDQNGNIYV